MDNIQEQMKELFGNSCYAYCLAYFFERTSDIKVLTKRVLEGWYAGYIDNDGYVSKPIQYIKMMNPLFKYNDIEKVYIDDLEDLGSSMQIVEYKKKPTDKASHFVVADQFGVLFDPSGDSQTVKVGKPFSYRKFITK